MATDTTSQKVSSDIRVLVPAAADGRKKITNTGDTVYYGGPGVTASSNDGSLATGASDTFESAKWFISAGTSRIDIEDMEHDLRDIRVAGHAVVVPDEYSAADSYQSVEADLNVGAAVGDNSDTSFFAGVMGNILGATLTKTKNYLGGLIGHYNVTGSKSTTYPAGAVLAGIGDGVTEADGAVVAYIDGDESTTIAEAAFKVMSNNSTAASGFDFGLDLQDAAHDSYQAVDENFYLKAPVRLPGDVVVLVKDGAPTDGAEGDGAAVADVGSLLVDHSNGVLYINTNTKASPTWTKVGTQS